MYCNQPNTTKCSDKNNRKAFANLWKTFAYNVAKYGLTWMKRFWFLLCFAVKRKTECSNLPFDAAKSTRRNQKCHCRGIPIKRPSQ
jgi:hypothetical protein